MFFFNSPDTGFSYDPTFDLGKAKGFRTQIGQENNVTD